MIEAVEHIFQIEQAIAANRTGDKSSTSDADGGEPRSSSASSSFFPQRQRATPDRDGLLKYVVLYVLTLVLQPLLAVGAVVSRPVGAVAGGVVAVLVVTTEEFTAGRGRCARAVVHPFQRLCSQKRRACPPAQHSNAPESGRSATLTRPSDPSLDHLVRTQQ